MERLLIFGVIAAALLASGSPATGGSSSSLASRARHVAAPHATRRPTAAMLAEVRSRNPVSTATAIAEGYWGATPCLAARLALRHNLGERSTRRQIKRLGRDQSAALAPQITKRQSS